MKIPKSVWIILIWALILGGFLFYQQKRLTGGHDIWVKPQPVDPRDMFRGDYVIFTYDFSRYHGINDSQPGREVYAILSNQNKQYFELSYFSHEKPADINTIFLKGKALEELIDGADITYNIESYFVPEGEGKAYENYIGSDLLVKIHINPDGEATLIKTNFDELKKRREK
ncbi:GDYXXLXY domain-containing protein [bacterium]|nr:GDYXXLXY domain-containing protein [bacterium]